MLTNRHYSDDFNIKNNAQKKLQERRGKLNAKKHLKDIVEHIDEIDELPEDEIHDLETFESFRKKKK